MKILWGLVKLILLLGLALVSAGTSLFWLPTGSQIVLPLAHWAVDYFYSPLKLEADNISGSVHDGYLIKNLKILSADEELFFMRHALISPDWDAVMKGMDGLPFVKIVEVNGVRTDLNKVTRLANFFAASSDKIPEKYKTENTENNLKINPFNLNISNVFFNTPYSNLKLMKLNLNDDGFLFLDSKIISRDNVLPVKINAKINPFPTEIYSSDLNIGQGSGNLKFKLEPFNLKLALTALKLDELLKFSPEKIPVKMSGRIDSRITMNENDISGVLSMPQANIMDIPLNFRLPFKWDMKNNFMLDNANLNTKAASVKLSSLVDIENLKVSAKGEAQNISITEIGRMFAPEANLKGDKGFLKFDLNTILTGDILNNTDGEFFIKMPSFSAAGFKILDNLDSHAKLKPNHAPELSLSGKIFGGKLFARGEADQDSEGNFKPKAIISVVNLDLNTLVASIPELKNSIEKPSGKISIKSTVHENFDVDINLNSDKLGAFGYNLTKLNGAIKYLFADQKINIEKFSSYFGKGAINANGNVNLNDQNFKFNADVKNFEPNIIPELKDVKGIYNLTAAADGKFSDVKTIKANANLTAQNVGYSDITLGNLKIPVNYSNNIINIPGAETQLPGGRLNFIAKIDINNASNPDLNILATTKGINLSEVLNKFNLQNNEMPITGSINGEIKLNGRLNSAVVKTDLTGEKIRVGKLVYIPGAILNAEGNMQHIKLNRLDAAVNFSNLHVDGDFYPDLNDFMASTFDINSSLRNFNLEPNLRRFTGTSSPVKGKLDLNAKLSGNGYTPVLILKVPGPLDVSGVNLEDIFINLRSPEKNNYAIISSVKTGKFVLGALTNLKLHGQNMDEVAFNVTTQPMKLANLVETFAPDAAGMAGGEAVLKVSGNYPLNIPIDVNLTADEIIAAEKIKILNLNVPVKYLPDKNSVSMKNANAIISDGTIRSNLNVDLNSTKWTGDLRVRGLDFGKIVTSFLPEGELIGSADLDLTAKGKYSGVWPNSYANGKFRTSPGYLHKMKMLDSVTPTKRVSYEYIKGTFYWDGKDLNFSPGTQAQAGPGEPLYRYVSVSGACGVLGEGLKLYFDGRFDLKILDRFLGAMKGIFQYMTGGVARNILKDSAGRILGLRRKDFQNISFTLANSWKNLEFRDLKITKPIEDFLPIDLLNRDQETQKDDKQFKLKLKFPTGKGNKSIEEDSTSDQVKEQLLDNLFNFGF